MMKHITVTVPVIAAPFGVVASAWKLLAVTARMQGITPYSVLDNTTGITIAFFVNDVGKARVTVLLTPNDEKVSWNTST